MFLRKVYRRKVSRWIKDFKDNGKTAWIFQFDGKKKNNHLEKKYSETILIFSPLNNLTISVSILFCSRRNNSTTLAIVSIRFNPRLPRLHLNQINKSVQNLVLKSCSIQKLKFKGFLSISFEPNVIKRRSLYHLDPCLIIYQFWMNQSPDIIKNKLAPTFIEHPLFIKTTNKQKIRNKILRTTNKLSHPNKSLGSFFRGTTLSFFSHRQVLDLEWNGA
ncbi:hypothetical protein BpHYR1_004112 [Brachionus plicatilis]|uniref:Uncharacterized protein n=1 Tax=Brachionus plicatilis TaxID=10195 RepID=A0A3M7R1P6_BRAPC|nr:hypothetical protein BpHYR1_004112 [Brachionus plicatilis]